MPESRYVLNHAAFPEDRVSYGVLKHLDTSPAKALYMKANPPEKTASMVFGSVVDAMLFGRPEDFMVHPTDASSRTKEFAAGKEAWAKLNPRGDYITQEVGALAAECALSVENNPLYIEHMCRVGTTTSVHCVLEEEDGEGNSQAVANVIDMLNLSPTKKKRGTIGDLKVVSEIHPHKFRTLADALRWDVQLASYRRNIWEIEGETLDCFWFAVENKPPWNMAVYEPDEQWLTIAENTLVRWIWEWHAWKNEPVEGPAQVLSDKPIHLVTPPWRT